jgi:hypothetical protein
MRSMKISARFLAFLGFLCMLPLCAVAPAGAQQSTSGALDRLKRIGVELGKRFDFDRLDPSVQQALDKAATDALKNMYAKMPTLARVVNGWQMNTDTMGVYGDYYLKRAIVAMVGLGANQPEDALDGR